MRRRVSGRGALDMRRLAKALEAPGIDLRHWVSHGTIGVVGDNGEADFEDNQAIVCGPDGVWADVLLMPLMIPVTARVQLGVGGSMCQISAPVRPGDEVLVIIPDGNLLNPPVIVAVLNAMSAQVGLDDDTKPVFRNDRLLVYADGVPVEVRSKSGGKLRMETDGSASFVVAGGKKLQLGASDLTPQDGVVTGRAIDSFTGSTQFVLGNASTVVLAKK